MSTASSSTEGARLEPRDGVGRILAARTTLDLDEAASRSDTMITALVLIAALASAPVPPVSDPDWRLGTCSAEDLAAQEDAAAAIRASQPGDASWVPHPFSEVPDEIVENFLARHRAAFSDLAADGLPPDDRNLFDLADRQQLRWEVHRVADWTNVACGRGGPQAHFWLVRLFDRKSSREIARVGVAPSGFVTLLRHYPADGPVLPPLLSVSDVPQRTDGIPQKVDTTSAQLVALSGTPRCSHLDPCVAWRSPEGIVIETREELLFVPNEGESLSFRDQAASGTLQETIGTLRSAGEHLVGLGGDVARAAIVIGSGAPSR